MSDSNTQIPYDVIGSAVGGITNLIGANQAAKNATKEGDRARQWSFDMMQYQNRYNLPSAQKQRLIDAGLSPSLMYQTMPQNVSESIGTPAINEAPSKIKASMFGQIAQQMQSAGNMAVQNDNIRAETALKLQQFKFNEANNPNRLQGTSLDNQQKGANIIKTDLDNELKSIENQYGNEFFNLRNRGMSLNTDQLSKAISYMDTNQGLFVKEKLALIANLAESTKTMTTQQALNASNTARNEILTELDKLEQTYRQQGMSFNDSLIFREVKATFQNLFKGISNSVGKKNNENTIVQSLSRMLIDLITK